MPFKAKNNREAVVVCAKHVVKRPSKRSVLVYTKRTKVFAHIKFTAKISDINQLLVGECTN